MTNILIVEDSSIQAEMLRRVLVAANYEVSIGRNGAEGLSMAQSRRPDLIISDVTMPIMDGFDLCQSIRSDASLNTVPVILLTAMTGLEDVVRGLNAGADNYATKPYDATRLVRRVREALARPSNVAQETKIPLIAEIDGDGVQVNAGPQQMLNLLLTTYSSALEQNKLLISTQDQLTEINSQLAEEVAQKGRAMHQLSFYDVLTGLANRRLLLDRLKEALDSCAQGHHHCAILEINLDNFRLVNDTRGHDVGDQLLIDIAERLPSLSGPQDTLSRLGRDEFVLVAYRLNHDKALATQEAIALARRVLETIQRPFQLCGEEYLCKASIGVAVFGEHDSSVPDLLKHANVAMFEAKRTGRNRAQLFDASLQAQVEERFQLENQLRLAIPGELVLMYQKQVDSSGAILGAEVLIRWQHPEMGMVPPNKFIPLAEDTELILPIGRWVLMTACQQIKRWESNPGTSKLVLAVNVSAKEFHQPDYVEQVLKILNLTGADPSRLKLELTESILAVDVDDVVAKMNALKTKGVSFSLDDFGTGFSSLTYLKKMPLDQLKIDQSFIRDVTSNTNDASIVRTVIALGQGLGLGVIAEGVETDVQRDFLINNGCLQFQGYLFGRPVPLKEFENSLK